MYETPFQPLTTHITKLWSMRERKHMRATPHPSSSSAWNTFQRAAHGSKAKREMGGLTGRKKHIVFGPINRGIYKVREVEQQRIPQKSTWGLHESLNKTYTVCSGKD